MRKLAVGVVITLMWSASLKGQVRTFVAVTGIDNAQCGRTNPCRTFGAALAAVAADGEVVVLETGGYGPMTITRGVTVHAPAGILGAIAPTDGNAITVDAPGAEVILRNLYLNSQGGEDSNTMIGVQIINARVVHIEQLVVSGFNSEAIEANGSSDYDVSIKDCILRGNYAGLLARATSGLARVSVDRVRAEDNSGNGFAAFGNSRVQITDCVATGSRGSNEASGYRATNSNAEMNVHHSVSAGNTNGIRATGSSTAIVRVSDSRITGNERGVSTLPGQVISHGNNSLSGNDVDGTFTSTIGVQ